MNEKTITERKEINATETAAATELWEALNGRLESLEARRKSLLYPSKTDKKAAGELQEVLAEVAQLTPQLNSINNKLGELGAAAARLRAETRQAYEDQLVQDFRTAELSHCEALLNYHNALGNVERTRMATMATSTMLYQQQARLAAEKLPIPNGGFALPATSDEKTMEWLKRRIEELSKR